MHRHPTIACVALACFAISGAAVSEPVVIQHPSASFKLSANEIRNLYLGNSKSVVDGKSVVLIAPRQGKARDAFMADALNKSEAQYRALWSRLTFTGNGQPPKELDSEEAVRKAVAENPGLIGFIDQSLLDSSVKSAMGN